MGTQRKPYNKNFQSQFLQKIGHLKNYFHLYIFHPNYFALFLCLLQVNFIFNCNIRVLKQTI